MMNDMNPNGRSNCPPTLACFEFEREVRLVDTDTTGFAHFGSYIRMMEETEYAFLRSRGLRVVLYDQRGTMGFPRLSASLDIHQPVAFGDKLTVKLELINVDGKQVEYKFSIRNRDDDVCVEGRFKAAFCRFPANQAPYAILMPEPIVQALTGPPVDSLTSSLGDISLNPPQPTGVN